MTDPVPVRAAPPLGKVIRRITLVAPLWGVLIAVLLIGGAFAVLSILGGEGVGAAFGALAFVGFSLIPALLIGYPIGLVVALLTSLLLVAMVRRFGWSRRVALGTALVPGGVIALLILLSGSLLFAAAAPIVCVGAAALTWWSSLRGLLRGTTGDIADVFA